MRTQFADCQDTLIQKILTGVIELALEGHLVHNNLVYLSFYSEQPAYMVNFYIVSNCRYSKLIGEISPLEFYSDSFQTILNSIEQNLSNLEWAFVGDHGYTQLQMIEIFVNSFNTQEVANWLTLALNRINTLLSYHSLTYNWLGNTKFYDNNVIENFQTLKLNLHVGMTIGATIPVCTLVLPFNLPQNFQRAIETLIDKHISYNV